MPVDAFKVKIVSAATQIIGNAITQFFAPDEVDKEEKLVHKYYDKLSSIAETTPTSQQEEPLLHTEESVKETKNTSDLTDEKIEGGTACLECSIDHFSTASGLLNEAWRMASDRTLFDKEIQGRIGAARDEMNALERIDLKAANIINLPKKEHGIAMKALADARNLRHIVSGIRNKEGLEKAAAFSLKARENFQSSVFELALEEDRIDKMVPEGLDEDEEERFRERMREAIRDGLQEGKT